MDRTAKHNLLMRVPVRRRETTRRFVLSIGTSLYPTVHRDTEDRKLKGALDSFGTATNATHSPTAILLATANFRPFVRNLTLTSHWKTPWSESRATGIPARDSVIWILHK
jgi:hypothetical protein